MGGDLAPQAPIAGALLALAELEAVHSITLVGRTDVVRAELDAQLNALPAGQGPSASALRDRIAIVEAP